MAKLATPLYPLLVQQLEEAARAEAVLFQGAQNPNQVINIQTSGSAVSTGYEQLRNAAEYSEEHLLLQRAIKRFLKRNLFVMHRKNHNLGMELITELILAGYLTNDSVSRAIVSEIDGIISSHMNAYEQLAHTTKADASSKLLLAYMSVGIEHLLNPQFRLRAFLAGAFQYYLHAIDESFYSQADDFRHYEVCLYIAVHQALLKSDIDTVRADLGKLYNLDPSQTQHFIEHNTLIDRLFMSDMTHHIKRTVSRSGAPMRILKTMTEDQPHLDELLKTQSRFLQAFKQRTALEYSKLEKRLDRGLAKSIAFIFLTKVIIGIGIEVPYDIFMHGKIIWLPLIINLLFPPLYLMLLRLGMRMPGEKNSQFLSDTVSNALYDQQIHTIPLASQSRPTFFKQLLYTLIFSIPVVVCYLILRLLDFNVVQMLIFFVFFSTASSLGFRLNSQVRELELRRSRTGLLASVWEFFYMPFIVVGQWLSSKYRDLNIVARVLDIVIELPLKSVIRLVRQWLRFLDEQRDRLD